MVVISASEIARCRTPNIPISLPQIAKNQIQTTQQERNPHQMLDFVKQKRDTIHPSLYPEVGNHKFMSNFNSLNLETRNLWALRAEFQLLLKIILCRSILCNDNLKAVTPYQEPRFPENFLDGILVPTLGPGPVLINTVPRKQGPRFPENFLDSILVPGPRLQHGKVF